MKTVTLYILLQIMNAGRGRSKNLHQEAWCLSGVGVPSLETVKGSGGQIVKKKQACEQHWVFVAMIV